ncbi:hypothetical protein MSSIT_1045 [Methanosarcina siciliae T4/M]|uniref:DUF4868 domain-containing protein n=1 Tax=Methanosarcina siciliae T4/M TaxID=1434120 RepID=A0A0E3P2N9_9EURY|nr:Kiwa anti-phage protein KwaB-like domain-containing protein [Methanosarcina siciliae]AKB27764.1 hypothetical protein MSSIT_1045 [Methanosarcina siciliae T4/M]
MTAQEVFENLINIEEIRGDVTLSFGSFESDSEAPVYRSLNISEDLKDKFLAIINKVNSSLRRNHRNYDINLLEYNPGYKPEKHEIEWVDLSEIEYLSDILQGIPDPVDIPLFSDSEDEFFNNLRFYVIIIQTEHSESPIYWFRTYSKKKELSRGTKLAAVWTGNMYMRLEQTGFLFDEGIDCIAFENYVFSINKNNFQTIFRFYDLLRELAGDCLNCIQERIPIANFSEFSESCTSHLQKLVKLRNIANRPYFSTITMEDIKRSIVRNNLSVETIVENGQEKIKFDPRDKWIILKVLDDAYLESVMTQNNYEVNSKRQVGGQE